jgi:hypothetical protein
MSGEWWNSFADVYYTGSKWYAADHDTGDRDVDPFRGDISLLVSMENQDWCRANPRKWLHEKFGDGSVRAVKLVSQGYVKVWIGDKTGVHGHLR